MTGHLERFPIRWNHLIEKESLRFKELEHGLIEKVDQLFQNMPYPPGPDPAQG
jgi:hypothetical protein